MREPRREVVKLEIGAGENPREGGFIHNDIQPLPHIEIVGDARSLPMIENDSVQMVRAAHVLEHFAAYEVGRVLAEWRRILVPGGVLHMAVPNAQLLINLWLNETITYKALLRDLYGLVPAGFAFPAQSTFRTRLEAFSKDGDLDIFFAWVYHQTEEVWSNPNTHHWGYSMSSLYRTLQLCGFPVAQLWPDGTTIEGWAEKPR